MALLAAHCATVPGKASVAGATVVAAAGLQTTKTLKCQFSLGGHTYQETEHWATIALKRPATIAYHAAIVENICARCIGG